MNRCPLGGYLVPPETTPFTDRVDHDVAGLPLRGCPSLVCSRCRQEVRSVVGKAFRDQSPQADIAGVYAAADLASAPGLHDGPGRLYLCRCERWVENMRARATDDPTDEGMDSPHVSWRCAGHPVVTLPHGFDGVEVTEGNLAELTKKAVAGWAPDGAAASDKPRGTWAGRLHARLDGHPAQGKVAQAAAELLDADDEATRARALRFFVMREVGPGPERMLALLQAKPALYAGIRDSATLVRGDKTLEDSAWRVIGPLVAGPAREVAEKTALTAGKGSGALYTALAAHDGAWLVAHKDAVLAATPDRKPDLDKAFRFSLKQ
jgi:hypothetical protein